MCSMLMKPLDPGTTNRRGSRSLIPLLILVVGGGIWVWGSISKRNLDQSLAVSFERAAHSVCERSPMPGEIIWLIPSLKSDFIKAITPWCVEGEQEAGRLAALTTQGDIEGTSGQASHTVTISADGKPVLQLRIRSTSADAITVVGWSTP